MSVGDALARVLRQDPDLIAVGELAAVTRLYQRGLIDRDAALEHASTGPEMRLELERIDRERAQPVPAPA